MIIVVADAGARRYSDVREALPYVIIQYTRGESAMLHTRYDVKMMTARVANTNGGCCARCQREERALHKRRAYARHSAALKRAEKTQRQTMIMRSAARCASASVMFEFCCRV